MDQSKIVARIEEICKEFDARVEVVGIAIARLELAKALAESEAPTKIDKCKVCNDFGSVFIEGKYYPYCPACHK